MEAEILQAVSGGGGSVAVCLALVILFLRQISARDEKHEQSIKDMSDRFNEEHAETRKGRVAVRVVGEEGPPERVQAQHRGTKAGEAQPFRTGKGAPKTRHVTWGRARAVIARPRARTTRPSA